MNMKIETAKMKISMNELLNIKLALYHYFKTMEISFVEIMVKGREDSAERHYTQRRGQLLHPEHNHNRISMCVRTKTKTEEISYVVFLLS